MPTKKTCPHDEVSRADYVHERPFWKCDKCNHEFLPSFAVAGIVAERVGAEADNIASVASAMLWDFHQRAVVEYGEVVASAVAPAADGEPCGEGNHDFSQGSHCTRCPTTMFFGTP